MFGLGAGEILIILFIALIAIGPEKLPGVAKNLARTLGEFQRAMRGVSDSIREPMDQIKQQIQDQANAEPVTEFRDDPKHDQKIPEDEASASMSSEERAESGIGTDHGETKDPWGPIDDDTDTKQKP